jgi:hypothetical protein
VLESISIEPKRVARALERLNLRLDLVSRTLVPAGPLPVASAA